MGTNIRATNAITLDRTSGSLKAEDSTYAIKSLSSAWVPNITGITNITTNDDAEVGTYEVTFNGSSITMKRLTDGTTSETQTIATASSMAFSTHGITLTVDTATLGSAAWASPAAAARYIRIDAKTKDAAVAD